MIDHAFKFDGRFHEGCVENAIPPSLLRFICMIEHGIDIKSKLTDRLCQFTVFSSGSFRQMFKGH